MKTEKELKVYADKMSNTIVVRTYENGNSSDTERNATGTEKFIISSIIFGALLAIRGRGDAQSIINASEYIGGIQLPGMNGYDTIYLRLKSFVWE